MKAKKELFVIGTRVHDENHTGGQYSIYAHDFAEFFTHCYGVVRIDFLSLEGVILGGSRYSCSLTDKIDTYGADYES